MYAGNANAVAAVVTAGTTAVTNSGSGNAYPRVTFTGTGSPSAVLYHLINATTGATIYFDTNILSGEILTLDLNPQAITFTSSLSGNILGRIAPGSTLTGFFLQPGVNSIVCFATGTSPTVVMQWPETYQSISELVE
jgi:phage-related protein